MKRLLPLLIVLLAAGAFSSVVLADDPPPTTTPTTTTAPPTTTAPTTTTAPALVPPGVVLGGVQIGGLDPDTAAQAVLDSFGRPATLRFEKTTIQVTPSLFALSVPIDSAIARAQTVAPNTRLALRATVDKALVQVFVAKLAKRFDRKPVASRLLFRRAKPVVTQSVVGRTVARAATSAKLLDELVHGTRATIKVQAKLRPPAVNERSIGPVVVIKRASNELTLYNGAKVVRRFGVATGQTIYPTPLGTFHIVVKWKDPWWYPPASPWAAGEKPVPPGPGNPLGTRWMGLSAPGVGIHGTPEDGSIGYSLSHGCIRMHIPQAEWLFDHVEVGTPVYIVSA
jgi:lipoprotein-anchoring transpeptidase ErfK/SrfK